MQFFKGDDLEKKFYEAARPTFDLLSGHKTDFFNGAYETAPLGDLIYSSGRAPLSSAILQSIFRLSFKQIFDAFVTAGTFESYIVVFKKIFGDNVGITFTVPAPGKLNIAILASGLEFSNFVARRIEDEVYIFDEVIDDLGNNIVFQTVKGFQSQYELETMLFEMVPGGIFTTITLTIGS